MTQDERRLKEIDHELYDICVEISKLKKKAKSLQQEKDMINGYHRIERSRQAYSRKGKARRR